MFSKNAKRQPVRAAWSITTRLSALYAIVAASILMLAVWVLYLALERNLERAGEQFLGDKVEVLRDILRVPGYEPARLEEEVQLEVAAYQFTQYFARVLTPDGAILIETPGMENALPPSLFPDLVPTSDGPEGHYWEGTDRHAYLLMTGRAGSPGAAYVVQMGLDISQQATLLAAYRRVLVLVLLLGVMVAAGAGALVAWQGLHPLRRITRQVEQVSAAQLNTRIGAEGWPRELTALATAFDAMMNRLEDAFLRLSRFSADLAHELRTPIGNLMGEAEVTLARPRTSEEYQQVLASSLEEYGRLARLIESLLFLARAENTEVSVRRMDIDARAIAQSVRDFYEAVAEEQGVLVEVHGQTRLLADPILVRRALSNLLGNALRHTPRGGQVEIAIETVWEDVAIHVRDTGEGIASDHLPHLFDRFYRVDEARTQSAEGTGLGLAIVKTIMELHGGHVELESTPGVGTTVTLRFRRGPSR